MTNKGFLLIANGSKTSPSMMDSVAPIAPGSFTSASFWAAREIGWDLHMGVNRNHPHKIKSLGYDIKFYNQHIFRNIFAFKDNWIAYRNLCKYLKDNPGIEVLHCNTPIGGVVGRLAGKKYKKKVIYTAHGFHFYVGAPIFNRTILKWIEMWLAHYTDVLITINQEDFEAAKKFKLKKGGKTIYIPGVGIDLSAYSQNSSCLKDKKRGELGLAPDDFVLISVGDLNDNKNTATIISALQNTSDKCHLLICGEGPLKQYLISLAAERGLKTRCHFLGFRRDIKELLCASDVFIMASQREGLPRSTMEAMACGLPCIVSDIRGNRDLIDNGRGGYLVPPTSDKEFAVAINQLMNNADICLMGEYNRKKVKGYDVNIVKNRMLDVYRMLFL